MIEIEPLSRFGAWTVLAYLGKDYDSHRIWLCQCSCGIVKPMQESDLKKGSRRCRACYLAELDAARAARPPRLRESQAIPADEVVVDSLVMGHRIPGASPKERRAAAEILLRRRPDWSQREVAEQVGVCTRTVERIVKRNDKERRDHVVQEAKHAASAG